ESYAAFCALSERYGRPWQKWPREFRRPSSAQLDAFRAAEAQRIGFHKWLQWLVDGQLSSVATEISLISDLAIGADPDGADAWVWQDLLASGIEVGAPPDDFNTLGQKWGFPPFDPTKLHAADYEPFIQTLRSAFRHAGGIRI